ncbi:sporulation integral membrane protein YlbJ [Peribacillus cavernae]|uniref:Sporulation integral membrane protein YlbJ n=1 Tax=Peribacillus cavernae TaxID=1674310 RepID=A0A3S0U552_9BACI|nr:sporulation integral membrane protein YlbJ [Peribacillus cavernae]MDQ0217193.1 sporulation integral membrane protein YlbJ [Peribacillus cavernae]RUQ30336.1 sporulation integral membrane protein YlbJ [Peribacillus cavernae]
MFKSKVKSIVLAVSITVMAGALISFPEESFEASIRGLNMWWEIVFPSLLPFFIISELLIGFGVVRFIGVLLEPLMRPLFKVPGVGGFVWAMGMASGNPAGAKYTARMRQEKQLTKIEAERLVSFTSSSNPLFIFGAVTVGFFHNKNLGIILALAHYLGNVCVGLIMRFHGRSEEGSKNEKSEAISIKTALGEMHRTRLKEKRPFGQQLGDAVISSVHTLLMIGGFIILFSVINKMLFHLNITAVLAEGIKYVLVSIDFPESLSIPFISGVFEITMGSQATSLVQDASLLQQAVMTSFILAFSGLSVQAQVASILAEADIRFFPYFIARIMQGFFSAGITILLWKPVYEKMDYLERNSNSYPVFALMDEGWNTKIYEFIMSVGPIATIASLSIYIFIFASRSYAKRK